MNYLAHLYLSGTNPSVKVGNFIGDHVKGRRYLNYPADMQHGILLHRRIDSFTDSHREVHHIKHFLRETYGRWSGVVVDIFFDHFLAARWEQYAPVSLRQYAGQVHRILFSHFRYLPIEVKRFLPFFVHNRRLESYAHVGSVQEVLQIMARYTSLPDYSRQGVAVLEHNYDLFSTSFAVFFDAVMEHVAEFASAELPGREPGAMPV